VTYKRRIVSIHFCPKTHQSIAIFQVAHSYRSDRVCVPCWSRRTAQRSDAVHFGINRSRLSASFRLARFLRSIDYFTSFSFCLSQLHRVQLINCLVCSHMCLLQHSIPRIPLHQFVKGGCSKFLLQMANRFLNVQHYSYTATALAMLKLSRIVPINVWLSVDSC